jgi:hypothetical protein
MRLFITTAAEVAAKWRFNSTKFIAREKTTLISAVCGGGTGCLMRRKFGA